MPSRWPTGIELIQAEVELARETRRRAPRTGAAATDAGRPASASHVAAVAAPDRPIQHATHSRGRARAAPELQQRVPRDRDVPAIEHELEPRDRARSPAREPAVRSTAASSASTSSAATTATARALQPREQRVRIGRSCRHVGVVQAVDPAQVQVVAESLRQSVALQVANFSRSVQPHGIDRRQRRDAARATLTGCSCSSICSSVMSRRSAGASRPCGIACSSGLARRVSGVDGLHVERRSLCTSQASCDVVTQLHPAGAQMRARSSAPAPPAPRASRALAPCSTTAVSRSSPAMKCIGCSMQPETARAARRRRRCA